ncbi:hypothetical protein F4677DRAFT_122342 [Hypoxylon crocopeplum]|nr:hypothetical protein F4677DRAFT_122342 [Hypoxylon crocopeplum]
MPSVVFAPKNNKHVFDNDEEEIVLSYLPAPGDKLDKEDKLGSDSPLVVDIESDSSSLGAPVSTRGFSPGPVRPKRTGCYSGFLWWCRSTWQKNKAPLLMFSAQLFGALMNLTARLLEVEEDGMHPMQLLFVRMTVTTMVSSLYIWWKKIPHGILGRKEIRWLLVLRGFCGFFGIYGMWYSVKYIPLAEATVITFLAPNIAGYICYLLIHDPFTRTEQIASFVALGGVVLITRPMSLFSGASYSPTAGGGGIAAEIVANVTAAAEETSYPNGEHIPTSAERLTAIGFALLGVLGAAGAITTLRWIGKRAHPLISVNYFGAWCTIVTTTILTLAPILDYNQPDLRLELPHSLRQWGLLLVIAACGLIMQVLMTAGLASEKSNRATAMIYTNMLFAAGFDRWIFGHTMGWMSLAGCGLIVGSALWVAVTKKEKGKNVDCEDDNDVERGAVIVTAATDSESAPMLTGDMDRDEGEGVVLRRL